MITRFAPSPTGPLHLGHAYSAAVAHDMARAASGTFLLRIEDTDRERARAQWERAIFDDLRWLGLGWPEPVRRQSAHLDLYAARLDDLGRRGLVYPCACNRRDIRAAASAPHEGEPPMGPDGVVYPGTCRGRAYADRRPGDALRLDMAAALEAAGSLAWTETGVAAGPRRADPRWMREGVGDVVLARRGTGHVAYHLAVVVDDAAQAITHVVRGADLTEATAIHVLLQRLLRLPTPLYHHHALVRDAGGARLAKRADAKAIAAYRAAGWSAAALLARVRASLAAP